MSSHIRYKYDAGESISAESIIGSAGKIFEKYSKKQDGITFRTFELSLSADCYVNLPITNKGSGNLANFEIEGLRGAKIYGQSKDCSKMKKVNLTAGHTQWQIILKQFAYCCINVPIHSRRNN